MKRLLIALAIAAGLGFGAQARDHYQRTDASLPEAAKLTIQKHFKADVSLVKIEKKFGSVHEYEVILTDGTEISFDRDGNWENVETAANLAVPASMIPSGVKDFVKKNHSGTHVVGIDKERSGYEIELSNGLDLKFDKNGKFMRYDD